MQLHPTKCHFGGKILEACICIQGGCSNHENARMACRDFESGKEDCYYEDNGIKYREYWAF
jgi:hypothetical protein